MNRITNKFLIPGLVLLWVLITGFNARAQAPYCAMSGLTIVEPITRVVFADIDNSSPASTSSPNYDDFTSVIGHVQAGQTYSLEVEGNTNGNYTTSVRAYFDWDGDITFTGVDEYVYVGTIVNSTGLDGIRAIVNVTIPAGIPNGTMVRMRIAKKFTTSNPSPNDGCTGGSSFGQYEDYTLQVGAAPGDDDPCVFVCPSNIYTTLTAGQCSAFVHYNVAFSGNCVGYADQPFTLTQNIGTAPVNDALDCPNTYPVYSMRAYANGAYAYNLTGVEVGSYFGGTQRIRVYTYSGTIGGANLNLAQRTLVYTSGLVNVPAQGKATISLGAGVLIPANTNFIVEQERPTGQPRFGPASSYSGETGPSYIYSVDCGLPQPTSYGSLGFGNLHLIQKLFGDLQDVPVPVTINQVSGLPSGSAFPVGTTTNCFQLVTPDGDVADECCFDVVVNPYPTPITSLGCNDLVHVSLDPENCEAVITAETMLEGGPYGCYENYQVAIGTSMAGPFNLGNTVTCANIGQTLAVRVTAPNGNVCWGWILVEDKLPPVVECDGCTQETNQLLGTMDWSDPTSTGFNNACYNFGAGSPLAGTHPYELIEFQVPVTGTYHINLTTQGPVIGGQAYIGIYQDPGFVVNSPCTNLIGGYDEFTQAGGTNINLTAGVDYQFVILDWGTTALNTFDYIVDITGPGGVGILAVGPCEIQCSDVDALLNAKTLADLDAIGLSTSTPAATDNCAGQAIPGCTPLSYTFTVGALSSNDMCAEGRYVPVYWTVTDGYGNKSTCTENIYVDLPTLEDVIFPDAVTVRCGDATDPDAFNSQQPDVTPFVPAYNPNAVDGNTVDEDWPAVNGHDVRNDGKYCNLVSQYHDDEVLICGVNSGAKKIIRRWTVIDWCTGQIREAVQMIFVEDNLAPVVSVPATMEVNASPYSCSIWGVTLPTPSVVEACSPNAITWKVYIDGVLVPNVPHSVTGSWVLPGSIELTVGTHTVTYEATDACGNKGTATMTLIVRDTTPPNVICKEFLQVTVNPNGCVNVIPADRFDNGSWDNCCSDDQLVFKVRRLSEPNDSYFRDSLTVGVFKNRVMYNNGAPLFGTVNNSRESHDDLTGVVTGPYGEKFCGRIDVIMRVYCEGSPNLYSDCVVQTFVDDKTRPIVTAPPRVIVKCEDDGTNHNNPPHVTYDQYFGYASWYDACGSLTIDSSISGTLNDCGEGVLVKTWRVTDKCGNQDVKSQTVEVRHISDFIVTFPADTMLTGCIDTADFTPTPHDPIWWPRFDWNDCEQLATTWWDERFYGENDACFKIVRHWKVINWCAYDVDYGNTNDDYTYSSWRLPITCKWRPSSINQFTNNDCANWRPGIYRRIQDGEYYRAIDQNIKVAGAEWNPDYRGDGVVEYIQVIKVKDNEKPIVQVINPKACPQFGTPAEEDSWTNIPNNTSYNAPWEYNVLGTLYNGICSAPAGTLKANAIDCSNKLNYHYEVDAFANPNGPKSVDFSGLTATINDVLPMGVHRVYWTVSDNCGNVASGNYWVRLRDCKKPSPVCFYGLATVVMPAAGMITLPAHYFNHQSFDNCTPKSQLKFSYSADVNDTLRTWTCADLQANGSPVFENITMYVTDADGNQDFCTTRLKVDDNDGVCGDDGTNTIVGKVTTYAPVEGIKDVVISYGNTPMYVTEGATGEYHFKTYNTNEQKLAGSHDKDYLNGVNVGDIIKIQNHILGKTQLDQPYKMLAADVNMDGSVKVSDIVEIRKLILGKIEKYNVGQSWRTFDSKYDLNMSNWAQTPDYVMVTPNQGQTTVNLNGVKLGDVDLNAKANFGSGAIEQRTVGTLSFRADDVVLNAGQTIEVPVKAKDFNNISGYQFTFAFDQSAIEFAGMKAGALNITAENYNADRASEGIVTTAVNVDAPMTVSNDEVLFTMVFNAKAETSLSKVLSVNSALTPAMGVNGTDEVLDVALEFNTNGGVVTSGGFELKQNTPNPFSTVTAIEYSLPQAGKATLTIYDVTGKVVYSKTVEAAKGMNKEVISRTQVGSTGVMFYQLVSGDYSATKKMVILE